MEYIIIYIPLFLSVISLFYFMAKVQKWQSRFIPAILVCLIADSVYLAYFFLIHKSFEISNINTPPFLQAALVFLFFFAYETLTNKKISYLLGLATAFPVIFWTGVFFLESLGFISLGVFTDYYWIGRYLTGFTISVAFMIYLLPYLKDRKLVDLGYLKIFDFLFFQLCILLLILGISVLSGLLTKGLYNTGMYFIKGLEIIACITLYFYLFKEYKNELEEFRMKRLQILQPFSETLVQNNFTPQSNDLKDHTATEEDKDVQGKKYMKVQLENQTMDDYLREIEKFFAANPTDYLNSDFNLDYLSKKTGIQKPYLSQVFNVRMQQTFNQFLNQKRIAHAKNLLLENSEISISKLADSCGYKSRTTLYQQFKMVTGESVQEFTAKLKT